MEVNRVLSDSFFYISRARPSSTVRALGILNTYLAAAHALRSRNADAYRAAADQIEESPTTHAVIARSGGKPTESLLSMYATFHRSIIRTNLPVS